MEPNLSSAKVSRRQFLRWSALTGAGAALAACQAATPTTGQPPGGATPSAPAAVIVEWWNGDPIDYQVVYNDMAAAFNASRSDIQIKVQNIPGGGFDDRLATMFAANQGPDVWMQFYAVEFARHGALENLDPYIEVSGINPAELWFPICGIRSTWEGHRYGVPRDVGFAGLVYNQDLFDELGVAYPEPGWTVDDFVQTAKALRNKEKGTWGTTFGGAAAAAWDSGPLPWNMGFEMTSPDGHQVVGYWDTPASIAFLQWLIDLEVVHDVVVTEDAATALGGGGLMAFGSGKVGLGQASTWELDLMRSWTFRWAFADYPVKERGGPSYSWSDSVQYYMWSGATKKDQIWEVMKYISGPEGTTIAQKSGKWASPCPSVWLALGLDKDPITAYFWNLKDLPTRVPNYLISEHQWTCIQPNLSDIFTRYIIEGERPLEPIVQDQARKAQECLDEAYASA